MCFDRVIVSTDENPMFYQFWPIVSCAWNKFFPDKKISLAFVTDIKEDDSAIESMRLFGDVVLYPTIEGIPTANHAKVARYYLAATYGDEVCLIDDIDSLPLQDRYILDKISKREKGKLLVIGKEVYDGTYHEGKFPIGYITGEGYLFKELMPSDINSLRYMGLYDHKEAINIQPNVFSDESLLRALVSHMGTDVIQHETRDIDIYNDWIDRSWWHIDENKLNAGKYINCNMLRPLSDNIEAIKPVVKYICRLCPQC
jgi:hypothetical protein